MVRATVARARRKQVRREPKAPTEALLREPSKTLDFGLRFGYKLFMTHAKLVEAAIAWLRRYRCGIVLSEQGCSSGEMPDAIGWKGKCHSVLAECKLSRADFLADREKQWRMDPEIALGCERYYVAPRGLLRPEEMPEGWGLLEFGGGNSSSATGRRRTCGVPAGS